MNSNPFLIDYARIEQMRIETEMKTLATLDEWLRGMFPNPQLN